MLHSTWSHSIMYLCVTVCVCDWCQHTHFRSDTDGLSRNSSSRLSLLRGGEGKSGGKINKTSLGFILFLFQNKQSEGGEKCRHFWGCYVLCSSFNRNNLDRENTTKSSPQQPERRRTSESGQVIYRKCSKVSHPSHFLLTDLVDRFRHGWEIIITVALCISVVTGKPFLRLQT